MSLFLRHVRSCALALLLISTLIVPAKAQPNFATLSKVSKVTTLVSYNYEGPVPYGISEARLRTLLELRLRSAGLRVLTADEDAKDSTLNPYVFLRASSLETANQSGKATGFVYKLDLSVRIFGIVALNGTLAPLELWADDTMGIGPSDASGAAMESMANMLIDSMLNQWLKENPK